MEETEKEMTKVKFLLKRNSFVLQLQTHDNVQFYFLTQIYNTCVDFFSWWRGKYRSALEQLVASSSYQLYSDRSCPAGTIAAEIEHMLAN